MLTVGIYDAKTFFGTYLDECKPHPLTMGEVLLKTI